MTVDGDEKPPRDRVFMDISIGGLPSGRLVFELFNDIAPKTAENFRALCAGDMGTGKVTGKPLTYKGMLFHRVVKDFMIQGGDFTNANGTGGESIYGGTFEDETFELQHDRPYLLSMANRGKDTNGSQFFITTQPAPHLDNVHVVFGQVVGGAALVKQLEALPVDRNARPLQDVAVANCGQLVRLKAGKKRKTDKEKEAEDSDADSEKSHKKDKKKKKDKKEKKKKRHQSGQSEEEEEGEIPSHPLVTTSKIDPKEIPEVPTNRFLMRGGRDQDRDRPDPRRDRESVTASLGQAQRRIIKLSDIEVSETQLALTLTFDRSVTASLAAGAAPHHQAVRHRRHRLTGAAQRRIIKLSDIEVSETQLALTLTLIAASPPHWRQAQRRIIKLSDIEVSETQLALTLTLIAASRLMAAGAAPIIKLSDIERHRLTGARRSAASSSCPTSSVTASLAAGAAPHLKLSDLEVSETQLALTLTLIAASPLTGAGAAPHHQAVDIEVSETQLALTLIDRSVTASLAAGAAPNHQAVRHRGDQEPGTPEQPREKEEGECDTTLERSTHEKIDYNALDFEEDVEHDEDPDVSHKRRHFDKPDMRRRDNRDVRDPRDFRNNRDNRDTRDVPMKNPESRADMLALALGVNPKHDKEMDRPGFSRDFRDNRDNRDNRDMRRGGMSSIVQAAPKLSSAVAHVAEAPSKPPEIKSTNEYDPFSLLRSTFKKDKPKEVIDQRVHLDIRREKEKPKEKEREDKKEKERHRSERDERKHAERSDRYDKERKVSEKSDRFDRERKFSEKSDKDEVRKDKDESRKHVDKTDRDRKYSEKSERDGKSDRKDKDDDRERSRERDRYRDKSEKRRDEREKEKKKRRSSRSSSRGRTYVKTNVDSARVHVLNADLYSGASEGTLSRWSRLDLQSLAPANPHWARVVGN
ncbi:hypothetical protein evm_012678 [Chilo suppressalis]|nr:hypothetical protein evm_012678 [Chilo suppressalis]